MNVTTHHDHMQVGTSRDPELARRFEEVIGADTWEESMSAMDVLIQPVADTVSELVELDEVTDENHANLFDLQRDKIVELKQQVTDMTEVLMEHPYEAVVVRALQLFRQYEDHLRVSTDPYAKMTISEFVLTDTIQEKSGIHLKRREYENGDWQTEIHMQLGASKLDGSNLPFTVIATSDRQLYVEQVVYKNYEYQIVRFNEDDETKKHHWQNRIERFVKESIGATAVPSESHGAVNDKAQRLLDDKLNLEQSVAYPYVSDN